VLPVVGGRGLVSANPRFAIACTEELLAEIGWYVRDHPGTWVQTHLAESPDECARVRELFPKDPSYTAVYDQLGLLTERTLLAHAIHLSEAEWRLIGERRSIVVHCPTANTFLEAGLFDLSAARRHGVRVALGTDVAAGADIAMPRVARAMIEVAKVRRMTARTLAEREATVVPTPAEAWTMITSGNAELLGWPDAGRLEPGAAADLLVLRPGHDWFDRHLIGRLIYGWSSELVETRVFNGRVTDPARLTS
jgi:guanine deaminase